jgi:hypothetical protein
VKRRAIEKESSGKGLLLKRRSLEKGRSEEGEIWRRRDP